ncbi:MAG: metalloregulator ArsR/SmtB family transcription factor [Planctomycetaceae bacterium]
MTKPDHNNSQPDTHPSVNSNTQIEPSEMISGLADPAVSPSHSMLSDELEKDLVQVFKLLADETRLKILLYLVKDQEIHVSALCERLQQSQPAVSHHLALLRVAGLIEARREGKHNFYSVRKIHFHRIMNELFSSMMGDGDDALRFKDFVVTQKDRLSE